LKENETGVIKTAGDDLPAAPFKRAIVLHDLGRAEKFFALGIVEDVCEDILLGQDLRDPNIVGRCHVPERQTVSREPLGTLHLGSVPEGSDPVVDQKDRDFERWPITVIAEVKLDNADLLDVGDVALRFAFLPEFPDQRFLKSLVIFDFPSVGGVCPRAKLKLFDGKKCLKGCSSSPYWQS